ncbi:hypothetical protein [Paenibacillus arenosi]|uniref:Uncharacterized protein n=1 Tax=Paenibacillus arenosi TaxID=2774142 RepID=A0ABR9AU61_9BACL|nr:hypothetical protein [Paenibacillus arenosi]MBD8497649.1 hypothetical protein [Paenibacillus arenosi]
MNNNTQEQLPIGSEPTKECEELDEEDENAAHRQLMYQIDKWSSKLLKLLLIVSLLGVVTQVSMHIPVFRNWFSKVERLEGVPYIK